MDDKGKTVKEARAGFPVVVSGWKEVPHAGDEMLQAPSDHAAQQAMRNRLRQVELRRQVDSLDDINERRRAVSEAHTAEKEAERARRAARRAAFLAGEKPAPAEWLGAGSKTMVREMDEDTDVGPKELRLVVKGDVSGSVEAVVDTLGTIGNSEVKVVVIHSGVGDVTKSDISLAEAGKATVVAFSVKVDRQVAGAAAASKVPVLLENVIYRLVEQVTTRAEDLLEPTIDYQVLGEATVQEIFDITVTGKANLKVAGSKVLNGTVERKELVRVMRNGEEIFQGQSL